MLEIVKLLLSIKFSLIKPKKSDVLVYDSISLENISYLLNKINYEIYYNRYEFINVYIFLITILRNGLRNIRLNYKLNYFKIVNPKIIITSIDVNPSFYQLKKYYPKPKYLCFQRAISNGHLIDQIKKFKIKDPKKNFKIDYFFVLGSHDKFLYSKYITANFVILGNVKNNHFFIKNKKEKKKNISFISSMNLPGIKISKYHNQDREIKIFKYLIEFCRKKKIQLNFICKQTEKSKKYFYSLYQQKGWKFIPRTSTEKTYQMINKSDFIIFTHSTLGHEAVAKSIKSLSLTTSFPWPLYRGFRKNGFYWSNSLDRKKIISKIEHLMKVNKNIWFKKTSKQSSKILSYSPKNLTAKKIIKKILK